MQFLVRTATAQSSFTKLSIYKSLVSHGSCISYNRSFSSSSSMAAPTLYVAGLGNMPLPRTRHSVGQKIVDSLATRLGLRMGAERLGFSASGQVTLGDAEVNLVLFKTKALMNISGPPIAQIIPARSRQTSLSNFVLVYDSLQQKPNNFHARLGGSAGGHNGVKSVIAAMGNNDKFWQLRIGIGSNRQGGGREVDSAHYVMEPLSPEENMYWSPDGRGIDLLLKQLEKIVLSQQGPQDDSPPQPSPKRSKRSAR